MMTFGAMLLAACENAKNDTIDNLIYINEASSAKTKEVTMQDGTTRTSVTIRLAKAAEQDVTAELAMDASVLESYNKKNETNYKMPSEENISFPKTVTIKAGSVSAEPIDIDIQSFETEGATYALSLIHISEPTRP